MEKILNTSINKVQVIYLREVKNRKLIWVLFLLLLFVSSYSREVLFRSINAIMSGEQEFYAKTIEIKYLKDWTISELNRLKYFLTVAYSLIFMFLTVYGLKLTFKEALPFQISLGIYGLVLLFAGILIVASITLSTFTVLYPYLRDLVGLIHNPILFLFMSIATFSIRVLEKE